MERHEVGTRERTRVVEHDNDVVERDMDVCKAVTTLAGRALQGEEIPLSMPSEPLRIAASKLASVFSGYAADACQIQVRTYSLDPEREVHIRHGDPSTLCGTIELL